ncbi:LacI family DNA-binding transcriptional regulator [Plantactinospora sp. KBS50]|uniref:LacI family DNA-binding transcriptional regulator n=1 Tax=Plantactinospora sp. KBS50 TaxID=2024580 RepID=UPI000BAABD0D|nr:LacI family DNA-binding transcriptional regulator [Plantactinospora sp. KBS50]ASW54974.1 LacI family transcriptional regulator [Plantactinospora sp. KBS50]
MSNSRVTVREIARLAGVSVATVSRVSNGTGQVSPEMRRRVLEAIEKHGYRPDHLGRALAARRHGALGLVFPGLSGPYFTELIQGFESEAMPSRSSVHILCTHLREDSDAQVLEMGRRVDGVAVVGGTISDGALGRLAQQTPVVVIAGEGPGDVPSVRAENTASMAALTRHLLVDHQLRDLVFVGNPAGSPDVTRRWTGFLDAHRSLGLAPPAAPVPVGLQQADGVLAAERLFRPGTGTGTGTGSGSGAGAGAAGGAAESGAAPARPGGVVCANDETALGVLVGALGRGLRVPQDLVITGFDDAPMAGLVTPGLTTVRQPVRELAAEAARVLLAAAAEPGAPPAPDLLLTTELVLRHSCGCPADQATSTP